MPRQEFKDDAIDAAKEAPKHEAQKTDPKSDALTLTKLAQRHGQWNAVTTGDDQPFKTAHLVASVYHGWEYALFASGVEPTMSDADYLAALDSANGGKVHPGADRRLDKIKKKAEVTK